MAELLTGLVCVIIGIIALIRLITIKVKDDDIRFFVYGIFLIYSFGMGFALILDWLKLL